MRASKDTATIRTGPEGKDNKAGHSSASVVRLKQATKVKIDKLLAKANTKEIGRKIKVDDLLSYAVDKIDDNDLTAIHESSLTNQDRLEMLFLQHRKNNRGTTRDDFIGLLLKGGLK